jgi:pimeloyl-ACP methyl ester carboxylesterase
VAPIPLPKNHWTDVNGARLHHLDWAEDGPPVVCLHGLTGNAHNFDSIARLLSPEVRVLALDLRGRGESGWTEPETYALEQYVDDLDQWLDTLRLSTVTLIGTSLGGLVTMLFASRHPKRVGQIVLCDVGPVIEPSGLQRIRSYLSTAPEVFSDVDSVVRWFRQSYPGQRLTDDQVREWVGFATRPLEQGGLGWRYDPSILEQMHAPGPDVLPPDLWAACEAMHCPTLVVRGGASDLLSIETVQEMERRMTRCTSVEVAGVGHAPTLAEPEATDALRRFLDLTP